jgi:hypothetical protein
MHGILSPDAARPGGEGRGDAGDDGERLTLQLAPGHPDDEEARGGRRASRTRSRSNAARVPWKR